MVKTVVINAVGLTAGLIGEHTPRLKGFLGKGGMVSVGGMLPAVTTSVQATYLTGCWPGEHGIVGNGWYFRDECEVKFWRQADSLVQRPRIWEVARGMDRSFTCANLFWWYAMYCGADYTVTPRPMYPADGRKIPDVWTNPGEMRDWLQGELGTFPLFKFWGPATSIESTRWIAEAAIRVDRKYDPTLNLIYLPHLDYCLQRRGPGAGESAGDLRELDGVCGRLIDHFEERGARIIVLSEYGISAVSRPVHLNRVLREAGLVTVREEMGRELLDAGASKAFAVADHQVAHVYVKDARHVGMVRELLEKTPGVERVLGEVEKGEWHIDHPRAGELVAVAAADSWFTYYYWMEDGRAPDFARTVDIHRKPGYDPVELFIDPGISVPKLKIAWALAKKKMGFRSLMEVIGLDATVVKGSHGRPGGSVEEGALLMSNEAGLIGEKKLLPTEVMSVVLRHLTERKA